MQQYILDGVAALIYPARTYNLRKHIQTNFFCGAKLCRDQKKKERKKERKKKKFHVGYESQ
jgi:hypothetical protein